MSQNKCRNCGSVVETEYCGSCGQKVKKKLTFKSLADEIYDGFFSFESPFLRSFVLLTINPAKVYRDYMNGAQKRYFSPVRYSFWVLALCVAIAGFYDVDLYPKPPVEEEDEFLNATFVFFNAVVVPFMFITAIVTSIFTRLMYRKEQYTLLEWFAPNLMNGCHFFLLTMPFIFFGLYGSLSHVLYSLIGGVLYFIWGIGGVLEPKKFVNYAKAFAVSLIGQLAITMIIGILGILIAMNTGLSNG